MFVPPAFFMLFCFVPQKPALKKGSEKPVQGGTGFSKGVSHWCEEESCAKVRLRLPFLCNFSISFYCERFVKSL